MKYLIFFSALAGLFLSTGAQAASWTVDQGKSTLGFTATQSGTAFTGKFTKYDAQIEFDPQNPAAGHAVVTIDMASAATGDKQRDEAIPGSDWFAVAKFPQAKFEATSFKALGGDKYEALGTLSIRDVKKDVILPFTLKLDGAQATVDGTLPLVRTEYGVGQGAWSSGQWVALQVDVNVRLVATRAK